jgi:hypothetical protein
MKINVNTALADAWAMWRADRDLLLRIVGPLVFLPQFAALLLIPAMQIDATSDEAAARDAFVAWFSVNGPWLVAVQIVALYGTLVLQCAYLGGDRPTIGKVLVDSLRLLPRYFLLAMLMSAPAMAIAIPLIGLAMVLPALYLFGRWLLATPELVAKQPIGAVQAIRRSYEMTRGNGLLMMAITGIMILAGQFASAPFLSLGAMLGGAPDANPVVKVILDALAAASATVALLAAILVRIALYHQLRGVSRGI